MLAGMPLPDSNVEYARTENEHILSSIPPPSTTSTQWKPMQSRKLYFPRPRCQFRLITLPRFGLWQYKKSLRFIGMQRCLSNPPTYTYCILYSHRERQWRTRLFILFYFFFPEQSASHQWVSVGPGGCQLTVGHRLLLPALLKGKQHTVRLWGKYHYSLQLWPRCWRIHSCV